MRFYCFCRFFYFSFWFIRFQSMLNYIFNEEARPIKSRKSVGDAVSYLQEKSEQEIALRKEEIELKKQEEGRIARLSEQQLKIHKTCCR